jgi:lysophospholipase L1-like esterase
MFRLILLLIITLCGIGLPAADRALNIMPMGDSITAAADPEYRGYLFRLLVETGHRVHFVGTQTAMPSKPEDAALDPDHEGHGGFSVGPGPSIADRWTNGKGNLYANCDEWFAPDQTKTRDVDIILLHVGVNDFANIKDLDKSYDVERDFASRYAGLLDKILSLRPRTAIIISSIIPGGNPDIHAVFPVGPFDKVNPKLREVSAARASHVFFSDGAHLQGTGLTWEPSDWNTGDVIHPNAQGQEKFARFWFAAITDLIARGALPTTAYRKNP